VLSDPIRVALIVAAALETCRVRYLVGGSLASAVSGEPRSTLDVDMVVELTERSVEPFAAALGDSFHVDAEALRRAIRERSSANVIHHETSTKVDLFIAGRSPIDRTQMDRRQHVRVTTDPDSWLYVYTPEDILLQKLAWYRLGSEVSDRQWRDVLGIILTQEGCLDSTYLKQGSAALGVSDLMQRALSQARGES
jgi:hypothetical protein